MSDAKVTDSARVRRAARSGWQARVFRGADFEAMDRADSEFWASIPVAKRAGVVWELSVELFELAERGTGERRLPRSAYRVYRR